MANESVFGQSSFKDLNEWMDKCRIKVLSSKGLSSKYGYGFTNQESQEYISSRNKIMDIIQKNKSITIELLFRYIDNDLIINPNVKNLIIDICRDGDVTMMSKTETSSQKEIDFVLTFIKRKLLKERVQSNNSNYQKVESNIEKILDNDFYASGRKLEFEKREKTEEKINIDLKRTIKKTSSDARPINREFKDIRNLGIEPTKFTIPKEEIKEVVRAPEPVIKKEQKLKIKEIDIFSSIPEKVEPAIKKEQFLIPDPIVKEDIKIPKKEKIKNKPKENSDVFEKYNEYDLLYITKTIKSIVPNDKNHKIRLNNSLKVAKVYIKAKKESVNIGKKIAVGFFVITILLSVFIPVLTKSPLIKEVNRDFDDRVDAIGAQRVIQESRQKYNDVFLSYNI